MSDPSVTGPAAQPSDRRATSSEIVIVLGLTAGAWLAESVLVPPAETNGVTFTDQHLVGLILYEVLLAALLVPWLSLRGWSPRVIAGAPVPSDVARGVGLWLATLALTSLVWMTLSAVNPDVARALQNDQRFAGGASAAAIVMASVLNPIFEEFLWLAYAVPSLTSRLGLLGACGVSVALRLSVHDYQGPLALLTILPIGVVFTWYYAKTRRLWPVIVAHMILDVVGLARFLAAR